MVTPVRSRLDNSRTYFVFLSPSQISEGDKNPTLSVGRRESEPVVSRTKNPEVWNPKCNRGRTRRGEVQESRSRSPTLKMVTERINSPESEIGLV